MPFSWQTSTTSTVILLVVSPSSPLNNNSIQTLTLNSFRLRRRGLALLLTVVVSKNTIQGTSQAVIESDNTVGALDVILRLLEEKESEFRMNSIDLT
jgi:hypothetical protein